MKKGEETNRSLSLGRGNKIGKKKRPKHLCRKEEGFVESGTTNRKEEGMMEK